ncbi:MAG: MCE family protein [Aeromicrobium erythreum]
MQDALDSTERLLTAVRPAQLSATLGALAQALDGRGETLGLTIETLDRYLARLQPKVPLLREDLRLLARNLDTLADVSPDALDAVRDALVTSRTIVDRRRDLAAVLDTGGDLVVEAERLASDVETRFVRAVEQSAVVVSVMFERRTGFPASLLAFTPVRRQAGHDLHGRPVDVDGGLRQDR